MLICLWGGQKKSNVVFQGIGIFVPETFATNLKYGPRRLKDTTLG